MDEEETGEELVSTSSYTILQNKLAELPEFVRASEKKLDKSHSVGEEFVQNVEIAYGANEAIRTSEEKQASEKRNAYLQERRQDADNAFDELLTKWDVLENGNHPQRVHELLLQQREECKKLLEQKDEITSKLEEELQKKREEYRLSTQQLQDDILLASSRVNEVVSNFHEQCRVAISEIKDCLKDVSETMRLYIQDTQDNMNSEKEKNDRDTYTRLRDDIWSKLRELNIRRLVILGDVSSKRQNLQKNVHDLFMQLSNVEAIHFKNLDRLVYNLAIMKLRIRENKIVCCEMKRHNIQAFDRLIGLRGKLKRVEDTGENKYQREMKLYNRTRDQVKRFSVAAKFLHETNLTKFTQIYANRDEEARQFIRCIIETDKFIWNTLLEKEWEELELNLPIWQDTYETEEQKILKKLKRFKETQKTTEDIGESGNESSDSLPADTEHELRLTRPLDTEKLLQFVCKEMEFLIGKNALLMCKSVVRDYQTFILSNSLFNDIGIKSEKELDKLIARVLYVAKENEDGQLILTPEDVLKGFEEYIINRESKSKRSKDWLHEKLIHDDRENAEFWKSYCAFLPKSRRVVWDTVHLGMDKIKSALESQLRMVCKKISTLQQNRELEILLDQHKKNMELE